MEDLTTLNIKKQIEDQYLFNKVLFKDLGYDIDNLSEEQLNEMLITMVVHITEECHEILRELNWKMHKRHLPKKLKRENILEEIVDVNKFLINFLVLLKVTPEEYKESWNRKTKIVEERYNKDRK